MNATLPTIHCTTLELQVIVNNCKGGVGPTPTPISLDTPP